MAFDRNANNAQRLLRQSQRMKGGASGSASTTGSVSVTSPLQNTGSSVQLNLLAAGGLQSSTQQLAIKLDPTTPGLSLSSSGLKFLIDPTNPGLTVSATGVKVLLNGASLLIGASGLSINTGGVGLTQLGALTTKGDLLGFSTAHVRVPVGANNLVLIADSAQAAGVRWGNWSPLTTKGDIHVFSTTDIRLPVGTDGQIIMADSAQTLGVKWSDPTFTKDVKIGTLGFGLYVKEGANATMGVATLVAGTVTVATTKVTAASRIFLTGQNASGTAGSVGVSARVVGTSFTITSTSGTDTRDIAWIIVEPA